MIKISHIASLKADSPEIKEYFSSVLIPGLFRWFSKNPRRLNFISYFHSLGVSAEFVSSAAKEIPELTTALDIALEISAYRFYSMYPDNSKSLSLLKYLFSLFRADSSAPVPESVIIFKPCESSNNEFKISNNKENENQIDNKNLNVITNSNETKEPKYSS